jgi:dCTP diphosphatase
MDIKYLQDLLAEFAQERDWEQFHSPKNLSMALAAESGELLELFQWLSEAQSAQLDKVQRQMVTEELADILLYLLRLADVLDVDLDEAAHQKLRINAEKYPVDLAKGNATKYKHRK